jgi:hypothetical protein
MPDCKIELIHFADRVLGWTWAVSDPRDAATLHQGGQWFDSPGAALTAARDYMASRAAERWQQ